MCGRCVIAQLTMSESRPEVGEPTRQFLVSSGESQAESSRTVVVVGGHVWRSLRFGTSMPDAVRHRHAMLFPSDHASGFAARPRAAPRPLPALLRLPGDPDGAVLAHRLGRLQRGLLRGRAAELHPARHRRCQIDQRGWQQPGADRDRRPRANRWGCCWRCGWSAPLGRRRCCEPCSSCQRCCLRCRSPTCGGLSATPTAGCSTPRCALWGLDPLQLSDLELDLAGDPPNPALDILSTHIYTTFSSNHFGYGVAEFLGCEDAWQRDGASALPSGGADAGAPGHTPVTSDEIAGLLGCDEGQATTGGTGFAGRRPDGHVPRRNRCTGGHTRLQLTSEAGHLLSDAQPQTSVNHRARPRACHQKA